MSTRNENVTRKMSRIIMKEGRFFKQYLVDKYFQFERFVRFVLAHFIHDDCSYRASALAFTSLLAIVPLMTVGFTVLSAFPVFQGLFNTVQNFIFNNFVPTTGLIVQNYLAQFAAQASRLSILGAFILLASALLVMVTIERAMNCIWRAPAARRGVSAFLLYWAILSLAPLFLGFSLAVTSYVLSMPVLQNYHAPGMLLSCIPFILSLIGFTFLYVVVPNCPVQISHGLCGGFVAAVLFEGAKLSFAYYLTRYNTYQLLYGAFASIPIFFVWVYWVWIITLLGAEISYALSVHHQRRPGAPLDPFLHALLWLNVLWHAQKTGNGLTFDELVNACDQPFEIHVRDMIKLLEKNNLIYTTVERKFMLSRDLSQVTLYELSQHLPYRLPRQIDFEQARFSLALNWHELLAKNDNVTCNILGTPLSKFFDQSLTG